MVWCQSEDNPTDLPSRLVQEKPQHRPAPRVPPETTGLLQGSPFSQAEPQTEEEGGTSLAPQGPLATVPLNVSFASQDDVVEYAPSSSASSADVTLESRRRGKRGIWRLQNRNSWDFGNGGSTSSGEPAFPDVQLRGLKGRSVGEIFVGGALAEA